MRTTFRCLGLGVLGLLAATASAGDDPPRPNRAKAPSRVIAARGVKQTRVVIPEVDQQTKLALLNVVRRAGSASHKVRAQAVRAYYRLGAGRRAFLPLVTGLTFSSSRSRAFAAHALGDLMLPQSVDPLARRALFDRNADVRLASVEGVKKVARRWPRESIQPFVSALRSKSFTTKTRAVEALGRIGEPLAVGHLVRQIEVYGGRGPRVNMYAGRQIAYVGDYDAEVAQAATIAKPRVGTIQTGAVLDARVIRTRRRMTIYAKVVRRALERITGAKVGTEPGAWRKWYASRRKGGEPAGRAIGATDRRVDAKRGHHRSPGGRSVGAAKR